MAIVSPLHSHLNLVLRQHYTDRTLNNDSDAPTQLNKYKSLDEFILLMNFEKFNKQYSFINAHDHIGSQLQLCNEF